MRKFFYLLIFVFCLSCNHNKSIFICNASKDTLITVKSTEKYPSTIVLIVSGNIDDTCKILGVPIYKNNFDKKLYFDSYSKETKINYEAYRVKKGKLKIQYSYK